MSEQRFTIQNASGMYLHLPIFDNGVEMADGDVCILLNEQQATIQRMKHSLNTIYKAFEKHYGYDMRNAVWLIDELSYDDNEIGFDSDE